MFTLLDLGNEVNAMHPVFVKKLGLVMGTTNVGVQKIDGTTFEIYGMVIAAFSMTDQANKVRFFEKILLMANISPDVVLGISFLILSSANIDFTKKKL